MPCRPPQLEDRATIRDQLPSAAALWAQLVTYLARFGAVTEHEGALAVAGERVTVVVTPPQWQDDEPFVVWDGRTFVSSTRAELPAVPGTAWEDEFADVAAPGVWMPHAPEA